LIAVAVICGVAHFRTSVTVALMAAAFVVVALSEWLASRARFVPPAVAFLPPLEEGAERVPYVAGPPPAWGTPELEGDDSAQPEALTMVESSAGETTDPWEQTDSEDDDDEPADVELAERGGIFKRRRR
jgi:hypothetical protein